MMLGDLGLHEFGSDGEAVAIVVGPNGSGKSNFLRDLAVHYRFSREVSVVCNTPHDRFSGLQNINRISVGKAGHSPRTIVKRAVATTIDEPDSRFYQIEKILEYCRYRPRFGFSIEMQPRRKRKYYQLGGDGEEPPFLRDEDFQRAVDFLERADLNQLIWIDPARPVLEFSQAREFSSVLRWEPQLRSEGVVRGVHVYLERADGAIIELHHASSGELALISSLVFLITTAGENPLIIVDEPENSLHPSWQREYVDTILEAMSYRNATLIIATHAPLVVTGALNENSGIVSVFQIRQGRPIRLEIDATSSVPNSIEEVLWRAFEVVTPANHFVSEQIVNAISQFEAGEIEKAEVLGLVDRMDRKSFDPKQKEFFGAVRQLVDKVETAVRPREGADG
jgi:predicted ATPase